MRWTVFSWWSLPTSYHFALIWTRQVCPCQCFQLLWPSGFVAKKKLKSRDHLLQKWNKTLFEQKHFKSVGSSNVRCGRMKQLISNIKYLYSLMYLVNNLWPGRDLKQIQTMSTELQGLLIIYWWEKRWILRWKKCVSFPTCMFINPN